MAFKDTWVDKVDGQDFVQAEDINSIAQEAIRLADSVPVRGVDYWTDADKAEIKSYVDEAILGGAW